MMTERRYMIASCTQPGCKAIWKAAASDPVLPNGWTFTRRYGWRCPDHRVQESP